MPKTNPYTNRQTASLAFDDEDDQAYAPARPSPARSTSRPSDLNQARRRATLRQSRWASFRLSRFLFRTRFGFALLCLALVTAAVALTFAYRQVTHFLDTDPHFRIASSANIQVTGAADAQQGGLTRSDLLSVFASDLGRNIFFVPLARRQAQLEQLPWVAHATVMRLLPDHLAVAVTERTPIAFVRLGGHIGLVDADGVLLTLPPATLASRHYSFPVVTGLAPSDLPESRAARMALYQRFVTELDSSGQPVSSQLSEVDLSDLEDVRAIVPAQGNDLLLHFGDSDFLARYRSYQTHLAEWRQQYPHLSAIDLRYDRQVVLKMAGGAEDEARTLPADRAGTLAAAPKPQRPATHPTHSWRPQ